MGMLEEIQRMRQSGMQEGEIILRLQDQGNSYRAISEAMSQSKIKQAIEAPVEEPLPPISPQTQYSPQEQQMNSYSPQEPNQQMQESMLPAPSQSQESAPTQEYFPGYNPQAQQNYDYSQSGLSSDTIMEISEQVVSEKLSDVRKKLEKISSFKTELESKTEMLEERLKRIEQIIDNLQSSVLKKVGDYVVNVEDIKTELIETQKTFAKVLGSKHHKEHKR